MALLPVSFVFIFYSAEVNQLPGCYQHFICCSMELSHVPGFYYYYFWRVEVKLNYCSLEVFPEPGLFWVFTLSGPLAWLFSFLSSIALKLTSFPDFISILSAVAWNYPTCQAFLYFFSFYLWRVDVKLTCCSLEVFHEPGQFCVFILSGSLAWLFCFYLI